MTFYLKLTPWCAKRRNALWAKDILTFSLVAALPAYLVALSGKGVHVVTVNDYLSRRDAAWMGEIYNYLGLSVGVLNHAESFLYDPAHSEKDEERDELGSFHVVHEFLRPATKKEAYQADITY